MGRSSGHDGLVDDLRVTLADNLRALIAHQVDRGGPYTSARAVARKAGVNKNTVQRMLRPEDVNSLPAVDTLDAIARVFNLRAWQLLIPGLVPSSPPVVSLTQAERDLYERLTDVAKQVLQHEQGIGPGPHPGAPRVPHHGEEGATNSEEEGPPPVGAAKGRR